MCRAVHFGRRSRSNNHSRFARLIPVLANSVKGTLRSRVKVVADLVHPRFSYLVRSVHQSPICRPEPCAELLCLAARSQGKAVRVDRNRPVQRGGWGGCEPKGYGGLLGRFAIGRSGAIPLLMAQWGPAAVQAFALSWIVVNTPTGAAYFRSGKWYFVYFSNYNLIKQWYNWHLCE